MTSRGFLDLDWKGDGVVGLGLVLGLRSRLGLGLKFDFDLLVFLERVRDGEGEGEVVLVKKEVIWRCGLTSGDLPLLWRFVGAICIVALLTRNNENRQRFTNTEREMRADTGFSPF